MSVSRPNSLCNKVITKCGVRCTWLTKRKKRNCIESHEIGRWCLSVRLWADAVIDFFFFICTRVMKRSRESSTGRQNTTVCLLTGLARAKLPVLQYDTTLLSPGHRIRLKYFITGLSARNVGGETSNGQRRLSSSVVVVCNTAWRARRWRHAASSLITAPWLHGGPVVLRPVKATPCLKLSDNQNNTQCEKRASITDRCKQ